MNRSLFLIGALTILSACNGSSQSPAESAADNAANASAAAADASASASASADNAAIASSNAAENAAAASSATAASASSAEAPSTAAAADFVTKAASTDMYEIAAAKLALVHASRASVKAFAQMMIRDHTSSTAKLKAAIAASGQTLALPRDLPTDLQSNLSVLRTAGKAAFDRTYVAQMVDTHEQALDTMQSYAVEGEVAQLKAFAAAVTPVVQNHLTRAQALQAKIGG